MAKYTRTFLWLTVLLMFLLIPLLSGCATMFYGQLEMTHDGKEVHFTVPLGFPDSEDREFREEDISAKICLLHFNTETVRWQVLAYRHKPKFIAICKKSDGLVKCWIYDEDGDLKKATEKEVCAMRDRLINEPI